MAHKKVPFTEKEKQQLDYALYRAQGGGTSVQWVNVLGDITDNQDTVDYITNQINAAVSTRSASLGLQKLITIHEANNYIAFSSFYTTPDGRTHVLMCVSDDHLGKHEIIDYSATDDFVDINTIDRDVVLTSLTEAYGDRVVGVMPNGDVLLCVAVLEETVLGNGIWTSHVETRAYISTDNGRTFVQSGTLPTNGGQDAYPYGPMVVLPSGLILVAAYNNGSWLYETTDGITFTVRSDMFDAVFPDGGAYNETSVTLINPDAVSDATSKLIAVARGQGTDFPHMILSEDGGETWADAGEIVDSSAKCVSPWTILNEDESRVILALVCRDEQNNTLKCWELGVNTIDSASGGAITTLGTDSVEQNRVIYSSVVNTKGNSDAVGSPVMDNAGSNGGFANPSLCYTSSGQLLWACNDMWSGTLPPYNGFFDQDITLNIGTYTSELACLITGVGDQIIDTTPVTGNAATTDYTQIVGEFERTSLDNNGLMALNGDIKIKKFGKYHLDVTLFATMTGQPLVDLFIEIHDEVDTNTGRIQEIAMSRNYLVYATGYTLNAHTDYELKPGQIIKVTARSYTSSTVLDITGNDSITGTGLSRAGLKSKITVTQIW